MTEVVALRPLEVDVASGKICKPKGGTRRVWPDLDLCIPSAEDLRSSVDAMLIMRRRCDVAAVERWLTDPLVVFAATEDPGAKEALDACRAWVDLNKQPAAS